MYISASRKNNKSKEKLPVKKVSDTNKVQWRYILLMRLTYCFLHPDFVVCSAKVGSIKQ